MLSNVGFFHEDSDMTAITKSLRFRTFAALGTVSVAAALMASPAAWAQTGGAASGAAAPATAAGTMSGSATGTAGMAGKTARADAGMLRDIAHANLAEIATGKLAVEKATDPKVKEFAQMMVDDHTKALGEVQQLAQTKDVKLPTEPDVKHKASMAKLKLMSGNSFDKSYVKNAGVGDHQATDKLLKKTQASAKDADVKALAGKMLPVVQAHLKHAQDLDSMKK
jgi:putative membrane protein